MRTADAVIIGGGVTGASIAFHLAGLGVRRVLILERSSLGAGGTGYSVGIIRQLYPTRETSEMVLRSLAIFERFGEAVGGESGFVRTGALIGVSPAMRPTLERTLALQKGIGIQAEIVDPADLGRIEPRIDPSGLGAVLWEPGSGYGDPSAVTAGFAAAARQRGAVIEQGVEIIAIRRRGDRVAGVDTATGDQIDAPVVINAAGLWAPRVARLAGVELPIVIGRHPVFVVSRSSSFGPAHTVYLDLAGGSYVRPETGDLTLTGSLTEDETQHLMDPDLLGVEAGFDEAAAVLARTARALPSLADARFSRGYAGAFDITPDWMPILDESPVRGFWIAAGMSGHGFKLSPAVGEMVAALVTGTTPPVSSARFRFDRFAEPEAPTTFVSSYLPPASSSVDTDPNTRPERIEHP
jgi:sarcosine oxidase subunit beta